MGSIIQFSLLWQIAQFMLSLLCFVFEKDQNGYYKSIECNRVPTFSAAWLLKVFVFFIHFLHRDFWESFNRALNLKPNQSALRWITTLQHTLAWPKTKSQCLDLNWQTLKSLWLDHCCSDYYVSSMLYVWQQFF